MISPGSIRVCLLAVLAGAVIHGCYKESILEEADSSGIRGKVLAFDQVYAFCDKEERLLLFHLPADTVNSFSPMVSFGEYHSIEFNGKKLVKNKKNHLGKVSINFPYPVIARNGHMEESYQLYFTNLPLIHIQTAGNIKDEPKTHSWFELVFTVRTDGIAETALYSSHAGIEIRGRTSAAHEKKSFGLELWENSGGRDRSASLLDMRDGEDWILDAMYVDPLHMRNKCSFEIWEKMWKNKIEIPFHTKPPGIQGEFVELFINQQYWGLYCLSERLDESLLQLKNAGSGSGAALYKAIDWKGGSTAFETYNSEPGNSRIWEGWEQIYPDFIYYWDPLAEIRRSVILASDEAFEEGIGRLLNLDVAADYYLFVNLILAHDNIIKNYFLATYAKDSPLLLLPWDLEGSWGIMWDGEPNSPDGLLRNGLFKRLMELDVQEFNEKLDDRWELYRASLFHEDTLAATFLRNADLLKRSGAIERENGRWTGAEINLDLELEYYRQWTSLRLEYLDRFFE